jgi:ABC-2 type transport system ATP-binding protein
MVRVKCDDPRRLAAALVVEPVTTSIRLTADGRFVAETNDIRQFSRLVPDIARREGIRLFEMQPVDESLTSVFAYLVGK